MATETLYATSFLAGDFANPTNAVGNTPTTWAGVNNTNTTETGRWALGDPIDALTPAATQTINVRVRKGTNSGNPNVTISLYENGTLIAQLGTGVAITSTTGQTVSVTFNTSQITNRANVEIEIIGNFVGGNATTRNSPQVAYIEWVADVSAAAPQSIAVSPVTEVESIPAVGVVREHIVELGLSNPDAPDTFDNHAYSVRAAVVSGNADLDVELREGANVRKSSQHSLTATPTTFETTLNSTEAQTITNYGNLSLWFRAFGVQPFEVRIYWVRVQVDEGTVGAQVIPVNPILESESITAVDIAQTQVIAVTGVSESESIPATALSQRQVVTVTPVTESESIIAIDSVQTTAFSVSPALETEILPPIGAIQAQTASVAPVTEAEGVPAVQVTQAQSIAVGAISEDESIPDVAVNQPQAGNPVFNDAVFWWNPDPAGDGSAASVDEISTQSASGATEGPVVSGTHKGATRKGRSYLNQVSRFALTPLDPYAGAGSAASVMSVWRLPNTSMRVAPFSYVESTVNNESAVVDVNGGTGNLVGDLRAGGGTPGGTNWPRVEAPWDLDTEFHVSVVTWEMVSSSVMRIEVWRDGVMVGFDESNMSASSPTWDRLSVGRLDRGTPVEATGGEVYRTLAWSRKLTTDETRHVLHDPWNERQIIAVEAVVESESLPAVSPVIGQPNPVFNDAEFIWNPGDSETPSFDEVTDASASGTTEGNIVTHEGRTGRVYPFGRESRFSNPIATTENGLTFMAIVRKTVSTQSVIALTMADPAQNIQYAYMAARIADYGGIHRPNTHNPFVQGGDSTVDSDFHTVIIVWSPDPTNLAPELFVDGVSVGSDPGNTGFVTDATVMSIGRVPRASIINSDNGQVYRAYAWARPVTANELDALFADPWNEGVSDDSQSIEVSPFTELEEILAPALVQNQVIAVTPITESESLVAVGFAQRQVIAVTPITESESLFSVNFAQRQAIAVSPIAESEFLGSIDFVQRQSVTIIPITESESIPAINFAQRRDVTVSPFIESESIPAIALVQNQAISVMGIVESESLVDVALTQPQSVSVTPITESESIPDLVGVQGQSISVDPVIESVLIPPVFFSQGGEIHVNPVRESESVPAVLVAQTRLVSIVSITESESIPVIAFTQRQVVAVTGILESESINSANVVQRQVASVSPVIESELIPAVNVSQAQGISTTPITESEAVPAVGKSQGGAVSISPVIESESIPPVNVAQGQLVTVEAITESEFIPAVAFTQPNVIEVSPVIEAEVIPAVDHAQNNPGTVDPITESESIPVVNVSQAQVNFIAVLPVSESESIPTITFSQTQTYAITAITESESFPAVSVIGGLVIVDRQDNGRAYAGVDRDYAGGDRDYISKQRDYV